MIVDAAAAEAFAARVRGVAWLVDLEFTPTPIHLTTAPVPLTANGRSYQALGTLVEVGELSESETVAQDRLAFGLAIVNKAMIAATLGRVEGYRGRVARLYLQLYDAAFQPVGAPVLRWRGLMDRVKIDRRPAELPGGTRATGRIVMECSRAGLAGLRRAKGLRLTEEQQQQRHPGDTGLRYVRGLIAQPQRWLSVRFQQIE